MIPYPRITKGIGTYGSPQVFWWGEDADLIIGKYCSVSDGVSIFLGGEHRTDWVSTYPFSALMPEFSHIQGHPKTKGDVNIHNDVWIGYGATIMSGSTICSGSIIGAHAVINGYVGPYEIWAGNPARMIKQRFPGGDIVDKLLHIAWWDWSTDKIKKYIPLLLSSDIESFILAAKNEKDY
jgi:acetyltransferase-like isoleucine patch superfamily enzyme